jgi:ribosomal protein S18 acetylase RimI-like enzyme
VNDSAQPDVEIVPFRAEHGAAFYALNRAWLDEYDLYEAADEAQLADPVGTIIAPGGALFIALRDGAVVGTAAVVPHGIGEVELAKLTVSENARGLGLGRRLAEHCMEHARRSSVRRVVLVSSTKLGAAVKLYESLGFAHQPPPAVLPYASADVFMQKEL